MIDLIVFFSSLGVIFVFMIIMFFIAIIVKNNGIIDICWSLNFILATVFSFIFTGIKYQVILITQIISTVLILIWGLRLAIHIAKRNIGKPEDKRYKERREAWGKNFYIKTFFLIFMLQALWAAIIISPVIYVNSIFVSSSTSWIIIKGTVEEFLPIVFGLVVWVLGFYFEAMGDKQLRNFVKNPENKGKVIDIGLWKYTRHPNYFGEITMSWGIFLITLSLVNENLFLLITIIGPILYTLLIRYVTGVPEIEKHLITKPGYKEYKEKTSVLIPWIPKKEKDKS
ncbi:MAG: DUF1295 domain-containing protein [Candidatus Thorarchaeota archaeon]